jgi:type I restriction enzyme S subunit
MTKDEWKMATLGDVVEETQYGTSQKANEQGEGVPVLRMGNITYSGALDLTDLKHVEMPTKDLAQYSVRRGDLLFNRTNSQELVGKMAVWNRDEQFAFAGYLVRLRLKSGRADPAFVSAWFNTPEMKTLLRTRAKPSINMSNINATEVLKFPLPMAPLADQRRIAEVLDRAEALRAKRRAALAELDSLTQSLFLDVFGDPVTNPKGWSDTLTLGDVSDIVSGITKGRKLNGEAVREVPYMAVVNVQDKALNLQTVKTIEATVSEIRRYKLLKNDLLLTEGGDPDKLGRGTLWNDELPESIHQNHVFRVRLTSSDFDPLFLNWLVGSQRGKKYFLRSAKQTTGIASINMTQLRGFPLLVPPIALQQEFARRVGAVEKLKAAQRTALAEQDALFATLQHRAFRGEL